MQARFTLHLLSGVAGSLLALSVHAQNPIIDISGSTLTKTMTFAVYDIRSREAPVEAIQDAALRAIRLYAREATVQQGLVGPPYPPYPARMQLQETGGTPKPLCPGALFTIAGWDTSMAKYGEMTFHQACLFPYAGGYRINYFAIYGQRSGVGSANPNVLSAMMGRALGGLVGIGDASSFINTVMDRMESNLKSANLPYKLVELRPKELPGRVVEADDLPPPAAVATVPAQAPSPLPAMPIGVSATPPAAAPAVPAEIQGTEMGQLIAQMRQQQDAARAQLLAQRQAPTALPAGEGAQALAARKELTAIGLQYHSQEQFMAAIRRGDLLAVKLFVAGGAVSLTAADASGQTPLMLARAQQQAEIAQVLAGAGGGTVR